MITRSDFDVYLRNLQVDGCDNTLDVFRRSQDVLRAIQTVQIDEAQQLYDAAIGSLWARTIDGAEGENLNVLGRIVGLWPRPTQDAALLDYFTPDEVQLGPDFAGAWVVNAPTAGQIAIGDIPYRRAIRVKILKNHIKYGSRPELQWFARQAWGVDISVRNLGLADVAIVMSPSVPPSVAAEIIAYRTDETADLQYNLPLPTTARIVRVEYQYPDSFGPDVQAYAPDVAPVGVFYDVNA